ncbi:MAG: helix-turn-helix domain-containing protein [Candidatus Thermoplasmatota archaeon]|nr:helix-turn-helix domain-containing protein [Candidatus Thermoplasmatota archaeon]MBU1942026.1 helix-turn-helix domain-containing protein [Candidatus Thermoplasmatota archaeon]
MYRNKLRKSILFVIVLTLFITFVSLETIAGDDTANTKPQFRVIQIPNTDASLTTDFGSIFSHILSDSNTKLRTIRLNGKSTDVTSLPDDSSIIQLPQNRYAYRSPTKTTSLLPEGTTLVSEDTTTYVVIPGEAIALEATHIEKYDVEAIATTTKYDQSIEQLDQYELVLVLPEFTNKTILEYTTGYTIDWGDTVITTYSKTETTASHIYTQPGIYVITINITDSFGYLYTITKTYEITYEGHILHAYLLLEENKEPLAVTTTTSIGTLTLAFIILTETGKYKLLALLPFIIPLYTRISKEDVLDQFVRGQIFGFIRTNPGVHYNQIRRSIDVKNGTLSYHLRVLEKTELIKSRREGLRYRAFYTTGTRFPQNERFRLTELQIEILNYIKNNPGDTQRGIARNLNQKPQTINYNIKVLSQADLIDIQRSGRKTGLFAKATSADIQSIDQ